MYVEYSNEVWHTGFPGGQYAEAEASSRGISRLCYVVNRTRGISRIVRGVVGAGWRERVVVVVASQTVNEDATQQILNCDDTAAVCSPHPRAALPASE